MGVRFSRRVRLGGGVRTPGRSGKEGMMVSKFTEYAYGLLRRNVRAAQVRVILHRDLGACAAKRAVDSARRRIMREKKETKR